SRRLSEAEVLSSRPNSADNLVRTINEARENSKAAETKAEKIGNQEEFPQINNSIAKNKSEQENTLAVIAQNVGVDTSEEVLNSVALAIEETKTSKLQIKKDIKGNKDIPAFSFGPRATTTKEEKITEKAASSSSSKKEEIYKYMNDNIKKENKLDNANFSLEGLMEKINRLKEEIQAEEYESDDVNTLFKHFDKRIQKAEELIEDEQLSDFKEILESTNALSNNAKSFIKLKKEENNKKSKKYKEDDDGENDDKEKYDESEEENNGVNTQGNSNKFNKKNNKNK
ncbi:hypothetical protein DRH27_05325, partial [Candidatus Falkowbacteria bacterium]